MGSGIKHQIGVLFIDPPSLRASVAAV